MEEKIMQLTVFATSRGLRVKVLNGGCIEVPKGEPDLAGYVGRLVLREAGFSGHEDSPPPMLRKIGIQIEAEHRRAKELHPDWPEDVIHAAEIVAEEAGELVRAALQFVYEGGDVDALECAAVQTGAMAVRFLDGLPTVRKGE